MIKLINQSVDGLSDKVIYISFTVEGSPQVRKVMFSIADETVIPFVPKYIVKTNVARGDSAVTSSDYKSYPNKFDNILDAYFFGIGALKRHINATEI